jgi:hypothetical protein
MRDRVKKLLPDMSFKRKFRSIINELPKYEVEQTLRILSEMPQKLAIGTTGPSFQKEFS